MVTLCDEACDEARDICDKCDTKSENHCNLCDKCVTNTGKLLIINQLQMETIDIDLRVGRS